MTSLGKSPNSTTLDPYDPALYGTPLEIISSSPPMVPTRLLVSTADLPVPLASTATPNPPPSAFSLVETPVCHNLTQDDMDIDDDITDDAIVSLFTHHHPHHTEVITPLDFQTQILQQLEALERQPRPRTEDELKKDQLLFDYIQTPVHPTRMAAIQRAFEIFTLLDTQHTGTWSIAELDRAMRMFSVDQSHSIFSNLETAAIYSIACSHDDGLLRFGDFYAIFACMTLLKYKFNVQGTYLTPEQVHLALLDAGLEVNRNHLKQMFTVKFANGLVQENETNQALTLDESHVEIIDFPHLLRIYISAPRSEGDLFLFSWYKAGRTNFLLHKQHVDASPIQDFLAGTAAGVALTLVGHQFDTIKIRMQTGGFSNPIDGLKQTIKKEGFLALYKGMGGPMLTIPLVNAIVFFFYAQAQTFLEKHFSSDTRGMLPLWQITLAGMYAGLINCLVACPVELVKTHLQIQYDSSNAAFRGPLSCILHILRTTGPRGLFRGMAATVYRELPGYGAQFASYEMCKRFCMKQGDRTEFELTAPELMISGGLAGIMGWVFSYPMDYVKSQLQSEPFGKQSQWKVNKFLFDGGFIDCWKKTVKQSGHRELWKGFSVCLARGFPANAAGFLAYETSLSFFRETNLFGNSSQQKPLV